MSEPRSRFDRDDDWRFAAVHLSERAARLHEELRTVEAEAARIAENIALENRLEAHLRDRPVSSAGPHRLRSCDITALNYEDFSVQVAHLRDVSPGSIGLDEHQLPLIWTTALRCHKLPSTGHVTINLFYYALPEHRLVEAD